MTQQRLGCLSPLALLAAVLTVILLAGGELALGNRMFSPGPLNASGGMEIGGVRSHAELEADCAQCHPAPWSGDTVGGRCMACHTNIQQENADPAALHGGFLVANLAFVCLDCHTDHHGADAPLTELDPLTFPHAAAGFDLAAHAMLRPERPFACADCHTTDPFSFDPQICIECHITLDEVYTRQHVLTFWTDCQACHDGGDRFSDFDHNQTAFPLLGGHQQLDCADCHIQAHDMEGLRAAPVDCEACHLKDNPHNPGYGTKCGVCHSPEGWKPAAFDHDLAAFKLLGEHAAADCVDCHKQGFVGTPQECAACHLADDIHASSLGSDCAGCHTPQGWKPAQFDHNLSVFKLIGEHAAVACAECHTPGPDGMTQYKGIPEDCQSCHAPDDAHQGRFGLDCETCHTPDGWQPAGFDHNRVDFKLQGAHTGVTCAKCHSSRADGTTVYAGTPTQCAACHRQDDAHNGQFGLDCARCHTVQAWKPANFDHSQTSFRLQGRHAQVGCTQCHSGGRFDGTPTDCASCHRADDAHNGQFGLDCGSCHNPSNWADATFDHSRTAFALQGRHTQVACTQCHTGGQFKGTPTACEACHRTDDAHNGQFGLDCGRCHNPSNWADATFDHSQTGFPLRGQHANVTCSACHSGGFAGTPQNCVACHQGDDAHNGSFGSDCGTCHNPSSWGDATFDHARSGFPLTGAHANASCQACHSSGYAGTPSACAACHSEPAFHAGMFGGQACSACHGTSAWRPADYNGPHSFPMGHGDANSCNDCHRPNLTSWSCYNCHEQAKMADKHKEIGDYSNCLRCHADGRKHDD